MNFPLAVKLRKEMADHTRQEKKFLDLGGNGIHDLQIFFLCLGWFPISSKTIKGLTHGFISALKFSLQS